MNPRTRIVWTAAAVLAVISAFVLFAQLKALKATRAATADNDLRSARLQSDFGALQGQLHPLATREGRAASSANLTEGQRLAEQQRRYAMALHAWAIRRYERFFRQAGLSIEQSAKFEQALVDHWLRWSDVVAAAKGQNLTPKDPAFPHMWETEKAQFQQEEQAALGPQAYSALAQYERVAPAQTATDAVAALVYATSQPLTAQQGDALTQLLAGNSPSYQKGGNSSLDDLSQAAVISQAASFLTPNQAAALQNALTARSAGRELNQLLTQAAGRIAK